jgi:hypothetical protein
MNDFREIDEVAAEAARNGKPPYKSKVIIQATVLILLNAYDVVRTMLMPEMPPVPEWLISVLNVVLGGGIVAARIHTTKPIR